MTNIDIPALLQLAKEARAECSDKRGTLLNEHLIVPLYEAVEALAGEIDRLHQFYYQRNMDREHAREARRAENALREDKLRERLKAIDTLYDAIAHGDDNHRNWLRGKIDEHFGCAPSEEGGDAG